MRVQYQPSGGRGEYELSDNHDNLTPADLLDLELHARWGTFGFRRAGLTLEVTDRQGKYRLRILESGSHFPIQFCAGLLLPHAIREEDKLEGGPVLLLSGNYLVERVDLTSVVKLPDRVQIEFGDIEVKNKTTTDTLDFNDRLTRLVALHSRQDRLPDELRAIIRRHQELLQTNRPITRSDEAIVREVMREVEDIAPDYNISYMPGTDPLPALEKMVADTATDATDPLDAIPIDSIPIDELELRRRVANRVIRLVAVRGPKSVKFRRDVVNAYKFRCVVCGMRFPKNNHCVVAGVDAAHILAWRDIDLDETNNGLCLCKTHHWAFDQQLISIRWDENAEEYRIEVTELAEKALGRDEETLESLRKLERAIPREWLPRKRADWPHRQVLAKRLEDLPPVD